MESGRTEEAHALEEPCSSETVLGSHEIDKCLQELLAHELVSPPEKIQLHELPEQ